MYFVLVGWFMVYSLYTYICSTHVSSYMYIHVAYVKSQCRKANIHIKTQHIKEAKNGVNVKLPEKLHYCTFIIEDFALLSY